MQIDPSNDPALPLTGWLTGTAVDIPGAEELIANALQNTELLQSLASAPNPDADDGEPKEG